MRCGYTQYCCVHVLARSQRAECQARYAPSICLASFLLIVPNPVCATAPLGVAKRAETRECPICGDHIPLRLIGQHFTLESGRVQTILDHVGDLDAFSDPHAPPHAPYVPPLPYPDARLMPIDLSRAAAPPLLKPLTRLPSSLRASPRPSAPSSDGAKRATWLCALRRATKTTRP
jgi:hypothetical protein